MAPQKRTAQDPSASSSVTLFESENTHATSISKQKLAAQAQLAGSRGRRANGAGNGASIAQAQQTNNAVHSSLKDLANLSEAVRDQNGLVGSTSVCLFFILLCSSVVAILISQL